TIRVTSTAGCHASTPSFTVNTPTGRVLTPKPSPAPSPWSVASADAPPPPPPPPPPRTTATGMTVTPSICVGSPKTRCTVITSLTASSFDSALANVSFIESSSPRVRPARYHPRLRPHHLASSRVDRDCRELFEVLVRGAEHVGRGQQTLEVEVDVVLPGEA